MLWIALGILILAMVQDLRTREVADGFSVALLLLAVVATGFEWHNVTWLDLLGGFAVGLILSGIFFALGGLGGADVKLTAGLGAVLGLGRIFPVLFWIALAGGVLCLVAGLRGKKDIAYVPAIFLGLLFFTLRESYPWF